MKKRLLIPLLLIALATYPKSVDYNGNPINKGGSITITPQTSPAILASYTQAISFDGLVDKAFNGGSPVIGGGSVASATVLQSDGKIVAVGQSEVGGGRFCLIRYNTNGTVDGTFNGGSPVIGTATTNGAYAALLQPDGKIVAIGQSGGVAGSHFCLVRYNTNGSVDTAFNGGIPVIGVGSTCQAYAALLQPDGKIVAVGKSLVGGVNCFCLVRYNSNGSVDNTFGGGAPVIDPTGLTLAAKAALLQPDGKIVAVGVSTSGFFCLVRYNVDGSVDQEFNGGRPVVDTTGLTSIASGALLQPDGKIVAVGVSTSEFFCLVRYNTDGSVDNTFNGGNPVIDTTGLTGYGLAALLQPDGKMIALGIAAADGFCLARYNTDGSVDNTFNGGIPVIDATGLANIVYAALMQPDQKIVAAGQSESGQFCLVRYINPFTLASFTASYGGVGLL